MTIDEAIKILTKVHSIYNDPKAPVRAEAIKLGIEALKRILVWRGGSTIPKDYPLQGETKDQ